MPATVVDILHDGTGWEVEYPRDIWRMQTLPGLTLNPGKVSTSRDQLRFDQITQPWFRVLVETLVSATVVVRADHRHRRLRCHRVDQVQHDS